MLFLSFGCQVASALLFLVVYSSCHRVILAPPHKTVATNGRQQAALIIVAGQHIRPHQYVPIASRIQGALSAVDLWVSIIDTSENIGLVRTALNLPRSSPVFLLGMIDQRCLFEAQLLKKVYRALVQGSCCCSRLCL